MSDISLVKSSQFYIYLTQLKSKLIKLIKPKEIIYNRIYGYNRNSEGRYSCVENEVNIIKLIISLFISGKTIHEIKQDLDHANYRNRSNRLFTKTEIELFLSRKIYTGYIDIYSFNVKSQVYPAIISLSDFKKVQKLIKNIKTL